MARRSSLLLLLGAFAFGVLALPWLVYATGLTLLGSYAGGGASAFFNDFLRDLLTLHWYSWALALGPMAVVAVCGALWRLSAVGQDRVDQ